MSTAVVFNGSTYNVPAFGDSGYAQGAGNLSSYLVAIASGTLQTTGGTFTLSADVNFGSSFGMIAAYYKSSAANISGTGVLRLATGDAIGWRNNANSADILLSKDSSDRLKFGSSFVVVSASGNAPVEHRENYIAGTALNNYTGSLTVINLVNAYVTNATNLRLFINGLLLRPVTDYTETNTLTVTLASPVTNGDRIDLLWTTY